MVSRLFTAVLPPLQVVEDLAKELAAGGDDGAELRWTLPAGWHLTTSFMGAVSSSQESDLVPLLAAVAAETKAFELGVSGGVAFPHPVKARILAMAVGVGDAELSELSKGARAAADAAGIAVDQGRFVGHLTIARHNRGFQSTRWLAALDQLPDRNWTAAELCLVASRSNGGQYEVLHRFPFSAGNALD